MPYFGNNVVGSFDLLESQEITKTPSIKQLKVRIDMQKAPTSADIEDGTCI